MIHNWSLGTRASHEIFKGAKSITVNNPIPIQAVGSLLKCKNFTATIRFIFESFESIQKYKNIYLTRLE